METPSSPESTKQPRPVGTLAAALWEELKTIHDIDAPAGSGASLEAYQEKVKHLGQAALCLSGGGIRSAAFCLGVLQALAEKGLLAQFHYLSTVSGGGYTGGWLTRWIANRNESVAGVQHALAGTQAPPQVTELRSFTYFLTPQPGLASPDTWAGVTLWVRNVLINWMLFLPGLFSLTLPPLFYGDALATVPPGLGLVLLLIGLACLGMGVYSGAAHLPSHVSPTDRADNPAMARGMAPPTSFAVRMVVVPIMIWAFLAPLVAAPSLRLVMPPDATSTFLIPFGSFVVMVAAYLVAAVRCGPADRRIFLGNLASWVISAALASLVLDIGLTLGLNQPPGTLAVLGPLWVTLAHLVQSLFFVALRQEGARSDLDREWLARLSAVKVVPALLWAVFACVCVILPALVIDQWASQFKPWLLGVLGVLSGPGAAFLAKSARSALGAGSEGTKAGQAVPLAWLIAIGTAVFAILLFMTLAWAAAGLADAFAPPSLRGHPPGYRCLVDLAFGGVSFLLAYELGRRINVNRFSMHAVYRNRLVRAFLGSARTDRTPDAFTGIDPQDNPRMSDMFTRPPVYPRTLFPVVNLTLNLTADRNNAWHERKAASFTVTPLASGSAALRRVEDVRAGKPVRGAYARTSAFAGNERETGMEDKRLGITLGTAITLSGAAASPNMGYHSSAAAAFLMTLFNVRLGAWLPNPATASAEELREAKPPNALFTLAREMLGRSDGTGPAIYLSDGGHFENLGLYEMVRRRCRFIVVIDAGEDRDAQFEDLGNAARKILIDFGVDILFDPPMRIGSRAHPQPPVTGCAFGRVIYHDGGPDGLLVYLRPCDLANAPIDVRAYRNANETFPQESTLQEWFSESRFESYRHLGFTEMSAFGAPGAALSLEQLFAAVRTAAAPPPSGGCPGSGG